jgi:hypothetical protein
MLCEGQVSVSFIARLARLPAASAATIVAVALVLRRAWSLRAALRESASTAVLSPGLACSVAVASVAGRPVRFATFAPSFSVTVAAAASEVPNGRRSVR